MFMFTVSICMSTYGYTDKPGELLKWSRFFFMCRIIPHMPNVGNLNRRGSTLYNNLPGNKKAF